MHCPPEQELSADQLPSQMTSSAAAFVAPLRSKHW